MLMITLLYRQVQPAFRDLVVDLSAGLHDRKEGGDVSLQGFEGQPAEAAKHGEDILMSDDMIDQPDTDPAAEVSKKSATQDVETDQEREKERPNPSSATDETRAPAIDPSAIGRYYQRLMAHTFAFAQGSGSVLRSYLAGQMPEEPGPDMKGAFAEIVVTYDDGGRFNNADVSTNSPELLFLLKQFSWPSMPSPSLYMLRSRGLFMKVTMEEGSPRVAVKVF